MNIVTYPDQRLRASNMPVSEFGGKLRELVASMYRFMIEVDGVGLAAPQIGRNVKLFVLEETLVPGHIAFCNPSWEPTDNMQKMLDEGCLSFPEMFVRVPRHVKIRAKFVDINGQSVEQILTGFAAQAFQHETDHINGILMIDLIKSTTRS